MSLPNEPRIDAQARGTRYIQGNLAKRRREIINDFAQTFEAWGCQEIVLPSVEMAQIYADKAGDEILEQMYTFPDRKGRELCLRPEGTASCQLLAQKFRREKDIKLWYEARCWRYERPQAGRYREFTQLGIEVLNPSRSDPAELIKMAYEFILRYAPGAELDTVASRGLAYYLNGTGFEIRVPSLDAQQQVVGGGPYQEGFGFALGLDRLLLASEPM